MFLSNGFEQIPLRQGERNKCGWYSTINVVLWNNIRSSSCRVLRSLEKFKKEPNNIRSSNFN